MQIVTLEEAKWDLERLLNQVLDDAAPTIVLLASGQQVVLLHRQRARRVLAFWSR